MGKYIDNLTIASLHYMEMVSSKCVVMVVRCIAEAYCK